MLPPTTPNQWMSFSLHISFTLFLDSRHLLITYSLEVCGVTSGSVWVLLPGFFFFFLGWRLKHSQRSSAIHFSFSCCLLSTQCSVDESTVMWKSSQARNKKKLIPNHSQSIGAALELVTVFVIGLLLVKLAASCESQRGSSVCCVATMHAKNWKIKYIQSSQRSKNHNMSSAPAQMANGERGRK